MQQWNRAKISRSGGWRKTILQESCWKRQKSIEKWDLLMGSLPCHIRIRRLDLLRFACWQPLSVLSRSDRKPQHKNLMIQSFNLVPRWPLVHCIGPASKSKLRDHPHSEFGTWGISWSERWKSWKILPKQLYNQSCCPWPKLGHWNPWFRFVPIYCSARALLWIPPRPQEEHQPLRQLPF